MAFRMYWLRMARRVSTCTTVLVCLASLVAGCGKPQYGAVVKGPKPQPASGLVKVDGKPAEGVTVLFHPIGGPPESSGKQSKQPTHSGAAVGITDKDGKYILSTNNPQDGAIAGEYRVTLSLVDIVDPSERREDQPPEAQRLPRRYQNPGLSRLTAKVKEGINELPLIEATTQVNPRDLAPQGD